MDFVYLIAAVVVVLIVIGAYLYASRSASAATAPSTASPGAASPSTASPSAAVAAAATPSAATPSAVAPSAAAAAAPSAASPSAATAPSPAVVASAAAAPNSNVLSNFQKAAAAYIIVYKAAVVAFADSAQDRATYLVQETENMGLGTMSLSQFTSAYNSGLSDLNAFTPQLTAWGAQVASLSASSPVAAIAAAVAGTASITSPPLQQFAPLAAALNALVAESEARSKSANDPWNVPTQDAVWDVSDSVDILNNGVSDLGSLGASLRASAATLRSYFIVA
jgi:hypothetical protein